MGGKRTLLKIQKMLINDRKMWLEAQAEFISDVDFFHYADKQICRLNLKIDEIRQKMEVMDGG